jgi:DNA repair protein RecN (Recombination protein N)
MSILSHLHIENIAVIESMEVIFGDGLNLLTGETGAGKSIVIDALGAVLGARTTRELVRTGTAMAHAGAVFAEVGEDVSAWLRETLGIEIEDGELSASRDICADGRTICRIAGKTVTVAQLRELGSKLVQIHGQHDSRMLLDEDSHIAILDDYGQTPLEEYQRLFDAWRALTSEREKLQRDDADKIRRADILTYQIEEITNAGLQPDEDKNLVGRRDFLKNAHKIAEAVTNAYQLIYGGEESAADMLGSAAGALSGVADINEELSELYGRLQDILYNTQDAAADVRALRDELDADPNELEHIEARLDQLYRLKRKYGATVEDIIAFAEKAQSELDMIEASDERLAELNILCEKELTKVKAAAAELSAARETAAADMQRALIVELRELDMPNAEFAFKLQASELYRGGAETVEFLLSANTGEPPKPLAKIASGGELSRVQLGLMNIIHGGVPTMVFDEVDAGISGRAAQKVAVKLKNAARDRQVLCVTHLPQIAAAADKHFRIEKAVEDDRTVTMIRDLSMDERVDEIARIIGGANVTEVTKEAARQLINSEVKK